MTIFEKVKNSVTLIDAVAQYGLAVNRNNMVCCPFHNDKNPSLKLNDTYFYCFGCGDVIDFVSALFGLSPVSAAQKLADDFGMHFFETSAKTNQNVSEVFTFLTKEILKNNEKSGTPS
ncbi:MAG: hypothetical protein IKE41_02495, partial [Clostridia bacterium]|nr:hypothetical protein [Clostridia bacterium]